MKITDFAPRYAAMDYNIKPGMTGVEVGVDVGAHAEALLILGVSHLTLVDIWDNKLWEGYCKGRLARWFNKTEFLLMTSHKAAKVFEASVHFAYIDITHDYETVYESLQDWWPKVTQFLGYRNYGVPEVKRAVDNFIKANSIRNYIDEYHSEIILFK